MVLILSIPPPSVRKSAHQKNHEMALNCDPVRSITHCLPPLFIQQNKTSFDKIHIFYSSCSVLPGMFVLSCISTHSCLVSTPGQPPQYSKHPQFGKHIGSLILCIIAAFGRTICFWLSINQMPTNGAYYSPFTIKVDSWVT